MATDPLPSPKPETREVKRAHVWQAFKAGLVANYRCSICGAVKSQAAPFCYIEQVPVPADDPA